MTYISENEVIRIARITVVCSYFKVGKFVSYAAMLAKHDVFFVLVPLPMFLFFPIHAHSSLFCNMISEQNLQDTYLALRYI